MKFSRVWPCLILIVVAACVPAQTAPKEHAPDPLSMIRDVSDLIANRAHKTDLKPLAEKLAKAYGPLLKSVPQQLNHLVADTEKQLKGLALREKMNLALELWRVRSSLDLMTLLTPETLAEVTGLKVEDLKKLIDAFSHAKVAAERSLPSWLVDNPSNVS